MYLLNNTIFVLIFRYAVYVEFMAWRKICMENVWHSKYVYLKMVKVEKGRVQVGEVLQSNSFSSSAKTWSKWHSDLFLRISFGKYSFCINPFLFMSPSNFCQSMLWQNHDIFGCFIFKQNSKQMLFMIFSLYFKLC